MAKRVERHKDGSVWARGNMLKGAMHGYWEWFRKDGTKMRSGYFEKGIRVGEWITYDAKGKMYKKTIVKAKDIPKKRLPATKRLVVCSRGHRFYKSSDCPVCPKCWPGYRKKIQSDFPEDLSAPALRALSHAKMKSLAQLGAYTEAEILKLHGMGPKAIEILKTAMRKRGLRFLKARK